MTSPALRVVYGFVTLFTAAVWAGFDPADLKSWSEIAPYFSPDSQYQGDFGPYGSIFNRVNGDTIVTEAQFLAHQEEIREAWGALAGTMPPRKIVPFVRAVSDSIHYPGIGPGCTYYQVNLALTENWGQEAYLILPDGPGPFAALVTWYYSPDWPVGYSDQTGWGNFDTANASVYSRAFGYHAAKMGIASLNMRTCLPHWGDDSAWYDGATPSVMEAYFADAALAYLQSRDDIDPNRIGIIGHSYGGKVAYFSGAWNSGFALAVASGAGVRDLDNSNWNDAPYFKGRQGALQGAGHDFHEITALFYPRPFIAGGNPDLRDVWTSFNHGVDAYTRFIGHNRLGAMFRPLHPPDDSSDIVFHSFIKNFLIDTQAVVRPLTVHLRGSRYYGRPGDTLALDAHAQGGVFPYAFTWAAADRGLLVGRHPSVVLSTPGINKIHLRVLDAQGQSAEASWHVTVGFDSLPLFPTGATWKYTTSGTDYTAFYQAGYNDSAWAAGSAPLGSSGFFTALSTPLPAGTLYFRKLFNADSLAGVTHLVLRHAVRGGGAFYLDGSDFFRRNIKPLGDIPPTFRSEGGAAVSGRMAQYEDAVVPRDSLLLQAVNVMAAVVTPERNETTALFDAGAALIRAQVTDTIFQSPSLGRSAGDGGLSAGLSLMAMPNPFNPTVFFRLSAAASTSQALGPFRLDIFNVAGQRIHSTRHTAAALSRGVVWHAVGRASGIYWARLSVGSFITVKRIVLQY